MNIIISGRSKRYQWKRALIIGITLFYMIGISAQRNKLEEGKILYQKGMYSEAENLFNELIDLYEDNQEYSVYSAALNEKAKVNTKKGLYSKADSLYLEALRVRKAVFGDKSQEYAESLNDFSKLKINLNQFSELENHLKLALDIRKQHLGEESLEYVESLLTLSNYYIFSGELFKVKDLINRVIDVRFNILGDQHPDYASALISMGNYSLFMSNIPDAEKYYVQAIEIYKQSLGEFHPDYIEGLCCLSTLYGYTGKYQESINILLKVLPIIEKNFGKEHPDYIGVTSNLGGCYVILENNAEAIFYLEVSLKLAYKVLGEKHSYYFNVLNSLAELYRKTGLYEKAEPLYIQSLKLRKELYPEENASIANALNSLGAFYFELGNYNEAEKYLLDAIEIIDNKYPENFLDYGPLYNNLAFCYGKKGNSIKALDLLYKVQELFQENKIDDVSNYLYVTSGILYHLIGDINQDYKTIENLFLENLQKQEDLFGKESSTYIVQLCNLALFYSFNKEYGKEEEIYQRILKMRTELANKNALSCHFFTNAGLNQESLGKYKEAYNYYIESFATIKEKLEQNFIFLSEKERELFWRLYYPHLYTYQLFSCNHYSGKNESLGEFAYNIELFSKNLLLNSSKNIQQIAFTDNKNNSEAWRNLNTEKHIQENSLEEIQKKEKKLIEKLIFIFPEYANILSFQTDNPEFIQLMAEADSEISEAWEYLDQIKKDLIEMEDSLYEEKLEFSEILGLDSIDLLDEAIPTVQDKNLLKMYENLKEMEDLCMEVRLSIASIPNQEFIQEWHDLSLLKSQSTDLNRKIQVAEKKIVKGLNPEINKQSNFVMEWEDIQNELKEEEIAIEFIRLAEKNKKTQSLSDVVYYAILLHSSLKSPQIIKLCSEDELQKILQESNYEETAIYSLIWQPLEEYMTDITDIYIAPSGILHNISFPGIKKGNHYLMDAYTIHNLLSTKDILRLKKISQPSIKQKHAALWGGADFRLPLSELIELNEGENIDKSINLTRGMLDYMDSSRGQGFDYLPGSRKEVQTIGKQLSDFGWKTSIFTDKQATETRFKSLSSSESPEVIHISTHGFYFPQVEKILAEELKLREESKENKYRLSDNPLMRSGLAFSGANHVWTGKDISKNIDDGILTAYEVANMNLTNTELVILSACKTGLGDIVEAEGVYGLQRAFRLAGVKSMIVSLWNIPDKETVEIMIEFYKQWSGENSLKEAFTKAQKMMRNKYPDNSQLWAGFVLIE